MERRMNPLVQIRDAQRRLPLPGMASAVDSRDAPELPSTLDAAALPVLFVVENDYYPRDMRVYNECSSLAARNHPCFVLAPRQRGEPFCATINSVTCFRYPHFEARSTKWLPFEYANAAFWIALLVPLLALLKRVKVIHVANPPDFIIPLIAWLKLFGVKLVYDVHDLAVETFAGKDVRPAFLVRPVTIALELLERLSILLADAVITTNSSIEAYVRMRGRTKTRTYVVRNSNPIIFSDISEVPKSRSPGASPINIGYFGLLADDAAAGLGNFLRVADALSRRGADFKFSIVGDGPGVTRLREMIAERGLQHRFEFRGFVPMPIAFEVLKDFDYGLVTWGDLPKNHLHTAMKVMDYMCCAVPVCSLRLLEQLESTGCIGVHADSFEEIAESILALQQNPSDYEMLRRQSLQRFNEALAWPLQERNLLGAYRELVVP